MLPASRRLPSTLSAAGLRRPCSKASPVQRARPTSHARALPAVAHPSFLARPGTAARLWADMRSPRFRRLPFARDGVSDPGRASAPRIAAPHMLPSTPVNTSASAILIISWSPPHAIVVYASAAPSPVQTQHSLPGSPLRPYPGRDSHPLESASFLAHHRSIFRLLRLRSGDRLVTAVLVRAIAFRGVNAAGGGSPS